VRIRFLSTLAVTAGVAAVLGASTSAPRAVEILKATGGLPAHMVNQLVDAIGFAELSTGEFIVLDRRAHTLYAVDAKKTKVRTVLQVGFETGKVLSPGVLSLAANDIFAVADAPNSFERIQYFTTEGSRLGGFFLQTKVTPRLVSDVMVLSGVGSMQFTGKTFLVNRPESGALFSEYDVTGTVLRHVGNLRPTGHEADQNLHLALNIGMPLVDPTGGFFFVFQTGVPILRKYDAAGTLLFERHIEGVELDDALLAMPTTWPRRTSSSGSLPLVPPLVRTAAVDRHGRLWISLTAGFTYVYDRVGEKARTIQFHAAGPVSPASFFFARGDRLLVTPGCYEFSAR
jgi:hypothetical protein